MKHKAESISMSDKVAILSKRPATIKNMYDIDLKIEGERTPIKSRKAHVFKDYFDILWKELNNNEN